MADAVTSQTIVDGRKNVVMKFTNISDGTGESAVTKVDVSALSGVPASVRIMKLHYVMIGMGARLLWDASADVLAFQLPVDGAGTFDFTPFGGIPNNAGSGVTGDIQLTTVSHSSGDSYSIILEMEKS